MKLTNHFADFLRDTVNLNQTRIDTLESSIEAIESFIKNSDWKPRVWKFFEQGSWAHNTIIRPVEGGEFDADLLVIVEPVEGWAAADYVRTLGQIFQASGIYKDKTEVWEYCVTITYVGDRKIDIAPCVRGREVKDRLEVCNRPKNAFEQTEPVKYTDWFNTKNGYSGANSFRKVARLMKYLRDIKDDFECPSIVLTTLIGQQISWLDKESAEFEDVPTTLKTITTRLNGWLQARPVKPQICNPELPHEDFASATSQEEYDEFRSAISRLKTKIDTAFDQTGRYASVLAWREVFGDRFAKTVTVLSSVLAEDTELEKAEESLLSGVTRSDAWHDNRIVDLVGRMGRWLWKPSFDRPKHMSQPIWPRADIVSDQIQIHATWRPSRYSPESKQVADFQALARSGGLWFDITVNAGDALPAGFYVRYRITNTGSVAMGRGQGRGGFETPQEGTRRWEELQYRGIHLAEAFIIRESDRKLVGQSAPFHVVIT